MAIRLIASSTAVLVLALVWGFRSAPEAQELATTIENGQPFRNAAGHAATFSTQGSSI